MSSAVLVIEDEVTLAKNVKRYLERAGYSVHVAHTGEEGLAELERFQPDVVVLDYQLGGMDGLEALREIRKRDERIKVLFVTAHGNVGIAVDAMKAGATDYLTKPVALAELKLAVGKAVGQERMEGVLSYYQHKEAREGGLGAILGESEAIRKLKRHIARILDTESGMRDGVPPAALITGETGTGKELIARAIHFDGPRREHPFVEVNCASLPVQLVESELYGYERGAFTDAKGRKTGLVEAAEGGTLFLDEIGELSVEVQVKLLKLLEDRSIRRLGSVRDRTVDVRLVAATNRDLEALVATGTFRSDLYFRLRVVQLTSPPLRNRDNDIRLLAEHFLALHAQRYAKPHLRLSTAALDALCAYPWPGNVRELRNVIEHAVLLTPGDCIEPAYLSLSSALARAEDALDQGQVFSLPAEGIRLEEVERDLLVQALDQTSWNITRAARLLGLTRDTLRYRMDKFELRKDQSGPE